MPVTTEKAEEIKMLSAACTVLGIDTSITIVDLKRVYRQQSRLYHADLCTGEPEDCKRKFNEMREAYLMILHYCEKQVISLDPIEGKRERGYDHRDRFYDGWLGTL